MTKLTVVIPVNGRPEFTKRFREHHAKIGKPYKLIIAHNAGGLLNYYRAMYQCMTKVTTPYVMLADNDDFLCRKGLDRAVSFLDTHPDYVCAGGQVLGFSVSQGCYGRLHRRYRYYHGDSADHGSSDGRIRHSGLRLWIYYAVHRTPSMQQIHREIVTCQPDLMLYEAFHVMRTLTLGKAHFDHDAVSYARQYGTSTSALLPYRKWSPYGDAYVKMVNIFARQGHEVVDAMRVAIEEKLRQYSDAHDTFANRLARNFPSIAAIIKKYRFLEWHRAKRQLGVAAVQAEREFAIIADILKPSPGRIAAVKHDHHHL